VLVYWRTGDCAQPPSLPVRLLARNASVRYRSHSLFSPGLLPMRENELPSPPPSTPTSTRLKAYPVCCLSPVGQDCSSRRLPSFVSPACRFFLFSLPTSSPSSPSPRCWALHISPRIELRTLFSCIHSDLLLLIFIFSFSFANCLAAPVAVTLSGTVSFLERSDQLLHSGSPFRISVLSTLS
jgi:hypothetical protein